MPACADVCCTRGHVLTCADVFSLCPQLRQTPAQRVRGMPAYEACSSGTFAIRFTVVLACYIVEIVTTTSSPLAYGESSRGMTVAHIFGFVTMLVQCPCLFVIHSTGRVYLFLVTIWNTGPGLLTLTPLATTNLGRCVSAFAVNTLSF